MFQIIEVTNGYRNKLLVEISKIVGIEPVPEKDKCIVEINSKEKRYNTTIIFGDSTYCTVMETPKEIVRKIGNVIDCGRIFHAPECTIL